MAESYKEMGINVSTIGVGQDFDLELMVELSKRGGGSSRFIADREEMEQSLGSELDRMVVPVARNLALSFKGQGVIAVSGFTIKTGKSTELLELLNEMAVVEITKVDTLKLVERDKLNAVLEEQEFALSDIVDTSKAIEIGKLLTAQYIVTGSVIEMSNSVVIFGRIIRQPIVSDMGFDWRPGKAFFLPGRVTGLTAQVYEELTAEKPMRKMFDLECAWEGPEEREFPKL